MVLYYTLKITVFGFHIMRKLAVDNQPTVFDVLWGLIRGKINSNE